MKKHIMKIKGQDKSIWKGTLSGIIAGLAASLVMNKFQTIVSDISKFKQIESGNGQQNNSNSQEQSGQVETDPATVQTAEAISENVFRHELSKEGKQIAGPFVHYIFGSAMAGIYGTLAELEPDVTQAEGLAYGTTLWLAADEIGVPLLKLSGSPIKYPLSSHAYALASHWVYGFTTELLRKVIRKVI